MYLYGENKRLDTNHFKYFDEGGRAIVYKNKEVLLKYYRTGCKYCFYMSKKLFNILKELNLPHLVTLYDMYYNQKSVLNRFKLMDGYTMKLVTNKVEHITNQRTEYLLDMISELEKMIDVLSRNKIIMEDNHYRNIIFSENDVTIIDPDQFYIAPLSSYEGVLEENKKILIGYVLASICNDMCDGYNYLYFQDLLDPLRRGDNTCIAKKFSDYFQEPTPYLTIKKNLHK